MLSYSLPNLQNSAHVSMFIAGTLVVVIAIVTYVQLVTQPSQPVSSQQAEVVVSSDSPTPLAAPVAAPVSPLLLKDNAPTPLTTKVTVNGQNIPVPSNGSVQKTVISNDGNTSVNLSVDSNTSGNSTVQSSNNVVLNLQTSSEVTTDNSE